MNKYICTNRNKNYQNEVEKILVSRKQEILDFFGVKDNGQFNFNIYIYNTIDDLVNGMKNRGFDSMPDYMCACHKEEDNSLNFFEPKDNPKENEWSKEVGYWLVSFNCCRAAVGAVRRSLAGQDQAVRPRRQGFLDRFRRSSPERCGRPR